MHTSTILALLIQGGFAAANAAFYAADADPISLGAAIFCGLMFIVTLAGALR